MKNELRLIPFREDLASHFKGLNLPWISELFQVEQTDLLLLDDPKRNIIDKGGAVFFVESDGMIVGTFALHKKAARVFELSKMAVAQSWRGNGIGKAMCRMAVEESHRLGAAQLILYSNRSLANAIHIYRENGFVEVPLEPGIYERADIKMELDLVGRIENGNP